MELHYNAPMYNRRSRGDLFISSKLCMQMMILAAMVIIACNAQAGAAAAAAAPVLAPAPAPAPGFENVTQLLVYGGDYSTFISLMIETKVDVIFQRMANDTETGVTIFAPSNEAFKTKLAISLLKNISDSQKVSLVEYHALNNYQSLEDLQNSHQNQTVTLASYNNGGGRYLVNITFEQGIVQVLSDWTLANMTGMVYSSKPLSIFALNQVLFPDDIFGLPSPSPAPAPSSGAPTPTPSSSLSSSSSSSSSGPSGSKDSSFAPPSFSPSLSSLIISFLSLTLLMSLYL